MKMNERLVNKVIDDIEQINLPEYGRECVANVIAQLICGAFKIDKSNKCYISNTNIPEILVQNWTILKVWSNPVSKSIYQRYIFRKSNDAEKNKNEVFYSNDEKETWLPYAIDLYKKYQAFKFGENNTGRKKKMTKEIEWADVLEVTEEDIKMEAMINEIEGCTANG